MAVPVLYVLTKAQRIAVCETYSFFSEGTTSLVGTGALSTVGVLPIRGLKVGGAT